MKGLLFLLVIGAHIHPPSQNTPERGDIGGGGFGIRSSPAAQSWRAREVDEAMAALGHRADLDVGGSGEGGTGAGILHWCQSLKGKEGGEGRRRQKLVERRKKSLTGLNKRNRLFTQSRD